jgi:hypothetical protein
LLKIQILIRQLADCGLNFSHALNLNFIEQTLNF